MNLKVLIVAAVLIVGGLFYFINEINKADVERLKQAEVAHHLKLEQEKVDEAKALQLSAQRQAEVDKEKALKAEKERQDQFKKVQDSEKARIAENEKEERELKSFKVVFDKWMTQDNIASSTARISIAAPVTELRKIRDELNELKITGCLVGAKSELLSAMDDEILMFVYFMQNDIRSVKTIDELKISYLNKLAEAIKQNTACKK